MVRVARAMAMATMRAIWQAMMRVLGMEIAIATATGVVGDKEGDG
jgi:hypothetical protein